MNRTQNRLTGIII